MIGIDHDGGEGDRETGVSDGSSGTNCSVRNEVRIEELVG